MPSGYRHDSPKDRANAAWPVQWSRTASYAASLTGPRACLRDCWYPYPPKLSLISSRILATAASACFDEAAASSKRPESTLDHGGHLPTRHGSARKGLRQTIGHRQTAPETKWSLHL